MAETATEQVITLKGSTQIVTEFFYYAINSILYQRGIYPPESFSREAKYGLTMLVSQDEGLLEYLQNVIQQIEGWLMNGEIQRLIVVITGSDSGETLERWVFQVEHSKPLGERDPNSGEPTITSKKSRKEVQGEIQAIIRQITASVTFLPLLNEPCTFDLLVYTGQDAAVPAAWEDTDPQYITNSSEVRLRSFTTKIHKVEAMVAFKVEADSDDEEV
ncbi:unnamed protein product [Heterosigma akashiwo]